MHVLIKVKMGFKMKKVTTAAAVVVMHMVACMAAAQQQVQHQPSEEIVKFCGATGFKETCIKSLANANSTEPKELIKAAFDSAVAEIMSAIKRTAVYKKTEADQLTRGALNVCEHLLNMSIFSVRRSFDKIHNFDFNSSSHNILYDVRVYLSAAITFKSTCLDAFAKTRGDTRKKVTEILNITGELLNNALAMVIEFEKLGKSLSSAVGAITDQIKKQKQRFLGEIPTSSPIFSLPPRATVAQDGSGDFKTIQEAVNTVPLGNTEPFVIFVKAGLYHEYVLVPSRADHVVLVGEGPWKTRITGYKSIGGPDKNGPMTSGTLIIEADSFVAKDIAIENTAGPLMQQAIAVRTSGDLGVFYNVHMDAYQDTLYNHAQRQLFRECRISGTVDFIFGNGIAVFQKCDLVVRAPLHGQGCPVTAQGRDEQNITGITIVQGCRFTAEKEFLEAPKPFKAYLGRPWKKLSTTVVMQSIIEGFISPQGWSPWDESGIYQDTLFYVEYDNTGEGAEQNRPPNSRVNWPGIHHFANKDEALSFTAKPHFKRDEWPYGLGVPYDDAFMDANEIDSFFKSNPFAPPQTTSATALPFAFSPQKTVQKHPHHKPHTHLNKIKHDSTEL